MHLGHFLLTELLYQAQPTAKRADEEQATTAGGGFAEILANREKMARTGMVLSMDLGLEVEKDAHGFYSGQKKEALLPSRRRQSGR